MILAIVIASAGAFALVVFRREIANDAQEFRDFLREHRLIPKHETDGEASNARAARMHALANVALAPLPAAIPLVERPGNDAYGYPRSYVDRAALRSLLAHQKYIELSLAFEQFQSDFEADFHKEYFISDAADAFETAEPELGTELDAWVKAVPDSFAPYLARGAHGLAVGAAARGDAYTKDTSRKNFEVMNAAFTDARADLERALKKKPRLVAALRDEIRISFFDSTHSDFMLLSAKAAVLCPGCFQVRVSQQIGLEPRWGGNYRAMGGAARAADKRVNPRFAQLFGYPALDRAQMLLEKNFADDALREIESACALGDNVDFLAQKARILSRQNRNLEAVKTLTEALDLRPSRGDLMFERASNETAVEPKDWQGAYLDLSRGLRIDPTSSEAKRVLGYVARGLSDAGWATHQQHRESDAILMLDEALELWPARETEQRRSQVLTADFHGTDAEIEALGKAADAAPHDEYLHARLDYALSTRKDWPRIAEMWTAYIAQNPTDGRAYFEIAGTYQQEHEYAAAHANLARACELGVSAACALAKGQR